MGCEDCVIVIENAVNRLPGVAYVGVSLSGGTMTVRSGEGFDATAIVSKVQALGYGMGGADTASTAAKVCRCRV
ncbi:Copper chaperone CopZ [Devosia lucknowensis]|uniref:Copper chaperone CopZ n=1 Tax=Devosia lucknowensis TaxID=1096929 RepID=A0A1Y6F0P1_9HYPH|nr:Copper chaperone CopZ [Devosia lucknowensis]